MADDKQATPSAPPAPAGKDKIVSDLATLLADENALSTIETKEHGTLPWLPDESAPPAPTPPSSAPTPTPPTPDPVPEPEVKVAAPEEDDAAKAPTCPRCGRPLTVQPSDGTGTCPHCGTRYLLKGM